MHYTDGLETERLITRFVTPDDAAAWVEYCSDPVATKFSAIAGKTPGEMAEFVIDVTIKRYADQKGGLQALISKETGELVGQCGLMIQEVDHKMEVEIGYHLLRKHWGKGYATEAAAKFRDYGFENNLADSLVSIIDPKNVASKNVATRNGMQLVATGVQFKGNEYELFRITRREWEALLSERAKVKS